MIKPIIVTKTFPNNRELPNYYRVLNSKNSNKIDTKNIIPISNDGGYFKKVLLDAINNATETIMLCSFILSDEEIISALLNAVERKVRIYLLFCTDIQLDKIHREDPSEFDKTTFEKHKEFLKKIQGKALARSAGLHAKFLLVDFGTSNQKGFISTANFTKEALARNPELGVILRNGNDLKQLFSIFQHGFWEESQQEFTGDWIPIKNRNLKPLPNSERIVSTSKNNQSLKNKIIELIDSTTGPLIISSYSFKIDNELTKKLIALSQKREITILTRPREANVAVMNDLLKNNASIYCYDYIHAKFLLAPNEKKGLIMTANFDDRGLETGYEVGIYLNQNECDELIKITQQWIQYSQYSYEKGGRISELDAGRIQILKNGNLDQLDIENESTINDNKGPDDLRDMDELKEISIKEYSSKFFLGKSIVIKRNIIPPKLPKTASQIKDDSFPLPVYIHKNKRYLLIKNEKQLRMILERFDKKLKNIILVTNF